MSSKWECCMRKVPQIAALYTTTMDKTNRDKMFPQGKTAVGQGTELQ